MFFAFCRYDYYSFSVIPVVGELVAGDRASYQYLVESIRRFPPQVTIPTPHILIAFSMHACTAWAPWGSAKQVDPLRRLVVARTSKEKFGIAYIFH